MTLTALLAAAVLPATPLGQQTWVGDVDYPYAGHKLEGVTAFELVIAQSGNVEACRTTFSSGSRFVDRRTCQLVRSRLRFAPAKDDQGRLLYGTYRQKVTWYHGSDAQVRQPPDADLELVVDRAPGAAALPAYVRIAYFVDTSGNPSACNSAEAVGGPPKILVDLACKSFLAQTGKEPVRNRSGEPVPAVKVATVKFSLGD